MKKLSCMIIFCFFGCISKIFSCDAVIPELVLELAVTRPTSHGILYSGQNNRNACSFLGIESTINEPFCPFACGSKLSYDCLNHMNNHTPTEIEDYKKILNTFAEITAIPYKNLIKDNEFKKDGEIISSSIITINNNKYKVILKMPESSLHQYATDSLLSNFEKKVNYNIEDKEELLRNGILMIKNGEITHGVSGYFKIQIISKPSRRSILKDIFITLFHFGVFFLGFGTIIYLCYLSSKPC